MSKVAASTVAAGGFVVTGLQDIDADRVETLLGKLSERGVLLTSYGNVRGSGSTVPEEEYWRRRTKGTCLALHGVRRAYTGLANAVEAMPPKSRWQDGQASQALCRAFLAGQSPRSSGPDNAGNSPPRDWPCVVVGHGELMAAMLFLGFAARFDDAGTGCTFRCHVPRTRDDAPMFDMSEDAPCRRTARPAPLLAAQRRPGGAAGTRRLAW
jgi:hypothetical protein